MLIKQIQDVKRALKLEINISFRTIFFTYSRIYTNHLKHTFIYVKRDKMKRLISLLALLILIEACKKNKLDEYTYNTHFEIQSVPDTEEEVFRNKFEKYVEVFGVRIFGHKKTEDAKILHAANIMAQYLDNDEDGDVDNPLVLEKMLESQAFLIMFPTQRKQRFSGVMNNLPDDQHGQDLYGSETHPQGRENLVFDAALEEVWHLISSSGYSKAYPDAFGEEQGSLIAEAMDVARGGQYQEIPSNYPETAWYTYTDATCEYNCQVTEYFYWGLTSLLGAQNYEGRGEEISHEWEYNTPSQMENDVLLIDLLQDSTYLLPTILPDGHYNPQ